MTRNLNSNRPLLKGVSVSQYGLIVFLPCVWLEKLLEIQLWIITGGEQTAAYYASTRPDRAE
jgi:hypothetical protein